MSGRESLLRVVRAFASEEECVKIPLAMIQDYHLSLSARGFCVELLGLSETERQSIDFISGALNLKKDTVRRYLEKLSSTGHYDAEGRIS